MNRTLATPLRSPAQALADLTAEFRRLPLTHPRRARIAAMIVELEDEIERRSQP